MATRMDMLFDPCGASKVLSCARRTATVAFALATLSSVAIPQPQRFPIYLRDRVVDVMDREAGIATSMFGAYVRSGELLVYPFYEFTSFQRMEYKPAELGFGVDQDFRGKFREHEANFFLAYAFNNRVAVELESALFTSAQLWKDPSDPSAMPATIQESGFGDTQAEIRYRHAHETATRPEIFSYLEVDFPFQRRRRITGTQGWEYKFGAGAIKGFSFGTLTLRVAGESTQEDHRIAFGEYALEYLKRFSPKLGIMFSFRPTMLYPARAAR